MTYPLEHMGASGDAIAEAASQAIAATRQTVSGRRTSSLKASYEAVDMGSTREFSIGQELAGAAQLAIQATRLQESVDGGHRNKRRKTEYGILPVIGNATPQFVF